MTAPLVIPDAPLVFDEESHTYSLGLELLPSVTTVLNLVYDLSSAPAFMVEYKAQLGTAVHRACELWDQDDLGDEMDERIIPYLSGWQQFVADHAPQWLAIEARVYHPIERYAGTIDRVAMLNGERWVLDIKTSAALHPTTALQLAAYQEAWRFSDGLLPARRGAVHLLPDGRYKLQGYENDSDYETFRALLNVYRWKHKNGLGGRK